MINETVTVSVVKKNLENKFISPINFYLFH